jgi:hypothetical protein
VTTVCGKSYRRPLAKAGQWDPIRRACQLAPNHPPPCGPKNGPVIHAEQAQSWWTNPVQCAVCRIVEQGLASIRTCGHVVQNKTPLELQPAEYVRHEARQ